MSEKRVIFLPQNSSIDSSRYWLSKTPEERVEAVELIREQYYCMIGYTEPPRMEKVFEMKKVK